MKILTFGFLMLFLVVFATAESKCFDSDDGNNKYEAGVTSYQGKSGQDYCEGRNLYEYYCGDQTDEEGNTHYTVIEAKSECDITCKDGACYKAGSSGSSTTQKKGECEADSDCGKYVCSNNIPSREVCRDNKCVKLILEKCGDEFACKEGEGCLRVSGTASSGVEPAPGFEDKTEGDLVKMYLDLVKKSPRPAKKVDTDFPEVSQVFMYDGKNWIDKGVLEAEVKFLNGSGYVSYLEEAVAFAGQKKTLVDERLKRKKTAAISDVETMIKNNNETDEEDVIAFLSEDNRELWNDYVEGSSDLIEQSDELDQEVSEKSVEFAEIKEMLQIVKSNVDEQCSAIAAEHKYITEPSIWQKYWPWSAYRKKTGRFEKEVEISELNQLCAGV